MKLISYLLFTFILTACRFNTSPYINNVAKTNLNEVALAKIKEQETNQSDSYKVAFISDTHNYYDDLDKLVKKINRNGPYAFVVVVGDITNLGLVDEFVEFKKFYDKLNYPCLVAIGNHDLVTNGSITFSRMFGEYDLSFEYKDSQFLIFNNNNWETKKIVPDFNWLEDQLNMSTKDQRILISHVSFKDHDRFSNVQISRWEQLFDTYNVDYTVNGHDHNPGMSIVAGGTVQITVGATVKGVYWELNFSPLGVSHKQVSF